MRGQAVWASRHDVVKLMVIKRPSRKCGRRAGRPGRSAHQAVERARQFIEDDAAWVVDVDLEAFFDRVQHDALMARLARWVDDKQVLRLIRRFLRACRDSPSLNRRFPG
jgi:hypothetical protein